MLAWTFNAFILQSYLKEEASLRSQSFLCIMQQACDIMQLSEPLNSKGERAWACACFLLHRLWHGSSTPCCPLSQIQLDGTVLYYPRSISWLTLPDKAVFQLFWVMKSVCSVVNVYSQVVGCQIVGHLCWLAGNRPVRGKHGYTVKYNSSSDSVRIHHAHNLTIDDTIYYIISLFP